MFLISIILKADTYADILWVRDTTDRCIQIIFAPRNMHVLQLIHDCQLHTPYPLFCDGTKVQEELQHLSKNQIAESMCTILVYGTHLPPHIHLESTIVLHLLCALFNQEQLYAFRMHIGDQEHRFTDGTTVDAVYHNILTPLLFFLWQSLSTPCKRIEPL